MKHQHTIPSKIWTEPRREGQVWIGYSMRGTRNGEAGGDVLPVEVLAQGDSMEFTVDIPKGIGSFGWYTQYNNRVVELQVNDGERHPYEPSLILDHRKNNTVKFTIHALQDVLLMGVALTFKIEGEISSPPQENNDHIQNLVVESGLYHAFLKMTELPEQEFVNRAVASGVWASIIKFYKMSGGK